VQSLCHRFAIDLQSRRNRVAIASHGSGSGSGCGIDSESGNGSVSDSGSGSGSGSGSSSTSSSGSTTTNTNTSTNSNTNTNTNTNTNFFPPKNPNRLPFHDIDAQFESSVASDRPTFASGPSARSHRYKMVCYTMILTSQYAIAK
jgi:hypothetical protein